MTHDPAHTRGLHKRESASTESVRIECLDASIIFSRAILTCGGVLHSLSPQHENYPPLIHLGSARRDHGNIMAISVDCGAASSCLDCAFGPCMSLPAWWNNMVIPTLKGRVRADGD